MAIPKTIQLFDGETTTTTSVVFAPGGQTVSTNNTKAILKVRGTIGSGLISLQIKWADGTFTDTDDNILIPSATELNYGPNVILRLSLTASGSTIDAEVAHAVDAI